MFVTRTMFNIESRRVLPLILFDEVVEQLLADELNDSLIYYHQMWTIIEHNCDDVSSLFYDGAATFDGATPYDAFYSDCAKALGI